MGEISNNMSTKPNNVIDYPINKRSSEFPPAKIYDLSVNPKPMLLGWCKPKCTSERAIYEGCLERAHTKDLPGAMCTNRYMVWIECMEACVQPALYGLLRTDNVTK